MPIYRQSYVLYTILYSMNARCNSIAELRALAEAVLVKCGVPRDSAELQADLLIEAELRAQPSHGLQRLPRLAARLKSGLADAHARGVCTWTRSGFLSVDGQQGLGPVIMFEAIDQIEVVAREAGLAIAAIRHANHIGMLAYYAEEAVRRGLIGIVMSTSEALVYPFGGTEALLGTNPLAIGIPSDDAPFILDFATSTVSMGKIHHHALTGKSIPPGWALDAVGAPTTDPATAKAIAPFGGAKGYGLGLGLELLVAVLAGSSFAPDARGTLDAKHPATKGDVILLIDPAARGGPTVDLPAYLDRLRASRPFNPVRPVAVPGDGARRRRDNAAAKGIELPKKLQSELRMLLHS